MINKRSELVSSPKLKRGAFVAAGVAGSAVPSRRFISFHLHPSILMSRVWGRRLCPTGRKSITLPLLMNLFAVASL